MQPRRIARELALLSIGQLSTSTQFSESQEIESAMTAAIRALSEEVRETLESASADLNRSSDRMLASEIKATDISAARAMLNDAIEMTQSAINRLGTTLELPEFIHIAQSPEVREFAFSLIRTCRTRRAELDDILTKALVDWQLSRLATIDRNILRLAVAEICILGIPDRVAINEAVELGKRYSTDEGHRFINGVLRRVTQNQKQPETASPLEIAPQISVAPPVAPPILAEDKPIPQTVIPAKIQSFVPPPVVPTPKPIFDEPSPVSEEKQPGIEIQQIIPAPPKRVIPAPTKKRGKSSSAPHQQKRVIPSPVGHKGKKRVIPSPTKPGKQGVDRPVLKTDERQMPRYERAESIPSDIPSDPKPSPSQPASEDSPWGTAPSLSNTAPPEPAFSEPISSDVSPWDIAASEPVMSEAISEPVVSEAISEPVVSEAISEPVVSEAISEPVVSEGVASDLEDVPADEWVASDSSPWESATPSTPEGS